MVYNLKKWLKFTAPKTNIKTMAMPQTKAEEVFCLIKTVLMKLILSPIEAMKIFDLSPSLVKNQK